MTDNNTNAVPEVDRESIIKQHLPLAGASVIDVGCGEGWLTQLLAPETRSVIGIDPSATAIERATAAKISNNETYLVGSADNLPVDDAWADIIVYYNSLHHVPAAIQPKAAMETARVLAPGGVLCIIEPLASGAAYELFQLVEDEADVYDASYRLIRELASSADFQQDLEEFFVDSYVYRNYEEFADHILIVDEKRKMVLTDLENSLRDRFDNLGVIVEGGRSYDQVHRLDLLRRL